VHVVHGESVVPTRSDVAETVLLHAPQTGNGKIFSIEGNKECTDNISMQTMSLALPHEHNKYTYKYNTRGAARIGGTRANPP
jgi:hypothetical protein